MQETCKDWYHYLQDNQIPGERGCCLLCDDAEPGCLCTDCLCSKCYWYSYYRGEGYCDLAEEFKIYNNSSSDYKIHNVKKESKKSFFCQVGMSNFCWVPKSVVDVDGFVTNWFVKKLKDKGEIL